MTKTLKVALVSAVAVVLTAASLLYFNNKKEINTFSFPSGIKVENKTEHAYIDTLSMVVINKIFGYDTIDMKIYYFTSNLNMNGNEVQAFISKNNFTDHNYTLFFSKNADMGPDHLLEVLVHELIHLKQYEEKTLLWHDMDYAIYKGDTIYFDKVTYENRAYEKDAFKETYAIKKQLKTLLYKE